MAKYDDQEQFVNLNSAPIMYPAGRVSNWHFGYAEQKSLKGSSFTMKYFVCLCPYLMIIV